MTKIKLIENWRSAWRMYSFWMSVLVAVSPNLLNLAIEHEIITLETIPGWFSSTLKVMTFTWMALRLIQQESLKQQAAAEKPVT